MTLHDLRQIVACLKAWEARAPESLDVLQQVTNAVQSPTPRLLNKTLIEVMELLQNDLASQLAALPPGMAERLQLCTSGMAAINSLADLAGDLTGAVTEDGTDG